MFVLFKIGLRVSEFCGFTVKDIDLENNRINVDHQLQRKRDGQYIVEDTKTSSGTRIIPMTDEVIECFLRILDKRKKSKVEKLIDGKTGFLCFDKNNMPMISLHWEKYFKHAVDKYNSIYKVQLPSITPHICRYTFCSNMAKSGINPKTLQYIMGHKRNTQYIHAYRC